MKNLKILFFLSVILFASCSNNSSCYYLDVINGNDDNVGTSPDKAWRTLETLNSVSLNAGDKVLLKRGSIFTGILEISAKGMPEKRIIIDAYGEGKKPCITAPDSSLYTILIKNSDYITLQNVEVINTGSECMAYRTGVKVLCDNYGISRNIVLNALDIHDVNGSLIKHDGGGSGILIQNKWKDTVSVFDSLVIENCAIRRCERNAIIWSAPWSRSNWHLSTNTIVRKNLIEEVPGDGIVPIGCDGALVEYNLMRNCPALLPEKQAAAGIWPWSCDNTIIQFNEVSDHKAPWDGQGFDSDFNCTNTTIRYNYSHDNHGGFILICNAGKGETDPKDNIGNIRTVVAYNISINDAIRPHETHAGIFSPAIHIAGPCENTLVNNNILHVNVKSAVQIDKKMIIADSWGGYANNTKIKENVFYTTESLEFKLTQSTNNTFEGNYYLGTFSGQPKDENGRTKSAFYATLLAKDPTGFNSLSDLMERVAIADGATYVTVVNKQAIEEFFNSMKSEN